MGLDIVAYSKLEPQRDERVEAVMQSIFSPLGEEVMEIFEASERVRCMDMKVGKWHRTEDTKETHFRAGSYSTYNRFRALLAECFHGVDPSAIWEDEWSWEGSRFFEMINGSDCDGVYGPTDSEKLHRDFEEGEELFQEFLADKFEDDNDGEYYLNTYRNFKEGYGLAAEEGVLIFC